MGHRMEVDVLDAVGEVLAEIISGTPKDRSEYTEGQLDFYKQALQTIQNAPADKTYYAVLAEAAGELGFEEDPEAGIRPEPNGLHDVGVVTGWTLAIGIAEGIRKGAEVTLELVERTPGVSGFLDAD